MFGPVEGLAPDPPDPLLPEPLHVQVGESIRRRIADGSWPPGSRLRSEPELAGALGISRGTLRRALLPLAADGILTQVQGKGTFVASPAPVPAAATPSDSLRTLSEDFTGQGVPLTTEVLVAEVMPAGRRVAERLAILEGAAVFRLLRVRSLHGRAASLLENWVPIRLAPGIEAVDFREQSLFGALEDRFGLQLATAERRFRAVLADEGTALLLGRERGTPLQLIEQLTRLPDGTPAEFSDIWLDTELVEITMSQTRRAGSARTGRAPREGTPWP